MTKVGREIKYKIENENGYRTNYKRSVSAAVKL